MKTLGWLSIINLLLWTALLMISDSVIWIIGAIPGSILLSITITCSFARDGIDGNQLAKSFIYPGIWMKQRQRERIWNKLLHKFNSANCESSSGILMMGVLRDLVHNGVSIREKDYAIYQRMVDRAHKKMGIVNSRLKKLNVIYSKLSGIYPKDDNT